ncbi:MAG: NADH:ubiquinone reductase (Na(+)-transporting) subunit B [Bacteroidetes bacterium]|nr:MAG: NADH:ubiquinone reductase (Na(+)-transporting) subunit B [Bacteroidota bacterium]
MKGLLNFFHKIEPDKEKSPFLHTVFDGFFTFLFVPNHVTAKGVHVRDRMDLKRLMIFVVLAMMGCYVFGAYNIGHHHFAALGEYTQLGEGIGPKLWYGLLKILPILIVTMAVGLGIEFYYASRKGHGIEEGFIVSGMLIPLIMPPDLPLWMLGLAVVFAVILGKEAFGGTGMNILNVALLTRVFVFFAYPTYISGDEVWISGVAGVDGVTGATPLALAAKGGWEAVTQVYSASDMWWGFIPGSIGETSKPLIILGALFLIFTRVASWRIMISMVLGAAFVGMLMNGFAPEITADTAGVFKFMAVPWYYQFYMGSFLFAMAFMATDPVTASGTNKGKWIYGFLIGSIGMVIRIINPAYPEGWMLAILLLNVFAPTIDHFVVEGNMKRRAKRAEAIA